MVRKLTLFISLNLLVVLNIFSYNYLPIVKCYDKDDYKGGRQNWDIDTDSHGIVYFGNSDGLLRNIFGSWHLTPTESNDVVRSLLVVNDTIWCGGAVEFGYFTKNSPKDLVYHRTGSLQSGQAWKIQALKQYIYIQTESSVIIYDKFLKESQTIYSEVGFFNIQVWKNQVWAIDRNGQLGIIGKSGFTPVIELKEVNKTEVRKLFIHNNKLHLLLFDGRLYSFNGNTFTKEKLPDQIEGKALFTALSNGDNSYLFGTISDGLFQVDSETNKIITSVNSDNDLIDNTVLAIGKDIDGNVWLGLDYGIAHIEIQNTIKPIFTQGATYFIEDFKGKTFLATNKGLYSAGNNESFTIVKSSEGQTWKLRIINDELYVCHNTGLYKWLSNKLIPIFREDGIMDVARFGKTNYYLLSAYSGLLLVQADQSEYKILENLQIWGNPKIEYDKINNSIWADSKWGSVMALTLTVENKVEKTEYPNITNFFKGENQFVFYDGKRFLNYSEHTFQNIKTPPFNTISSENIVAMDFDDNLNYVAYVQNGKPNLLANLHDGNFYSYEKLLSSLSQNLIENDEFIYLSEGELRVATDRGVTTFNAESKTNSNIPVLTTISKVTVNDDSESIEFTFPYITDQIELNSGEKDITFHFGVKKASNDLVEFRYRLWPYDKEWSEWDANNLSKAYTQLKGGEYKFVIQSRLNGGKEEQKSISIRIDKLWYQTKLLLIPILLAFLASIYLTVRIMQRVNRFKLRNESKRFQDNLLRQTVTLKNEQLLQYTEVISRKNGFLIELKDALAKMRNSEARHWENKISEEVSLEKKDFLFHKLFSEIHQDFINRLTEKHPNLTANDIRLLSFIRINLGNREIANLMNITPKSVDVGRYRLRKKLDLQHEEDLNKYVREL